jgi:hypothetical protein
MLCSNPKTGVLYDPIVYLLALHFFLKLRTSTTIRRIKHDNRHIMAYTNSNELDTNK